MASLAASALIRLCVVVAGQALIAMRDDVLSGGLGGFFEKEEENML